MVYVRIVGGPVLLQIKHCFEVAWPAVSYLELRQRRAWLLSTILLVSWQLMDISACIGSVVFINVYLNISLPKGVVYEITAAWAQRPTYSKFVHSALFY